MAEADRPPDPGGSHGVRNDSASSKGVGHSGARSFAAVTKTVSVNRFPIIRLAPRQYGIKDGKPSVTFSSAELQAGVDNLKHALIAKFSIGRPHIETIRQAFKAAWGLGGKCSIGALDARHILIVLDSELEARKVLAHPTRKIGHAFFRVFRWTKNFDTKKEPPVTTSWIRLMHLPPGMFNQGYIEPIVASFSRFIAIDIKTATLNNPSFARVCVELDITTTLPEAVWINTGGDGGFWQKIVYEGRLLFCSRCNLHGHSLDTCRKTLKRRLEEQQIWADRDEHGLSSGRPSPNAVAIVGNKPASTAREVLSPPDPIPQGSVSKPRHHDDQSLSLPIVAKTTHADDPEACWTLVQKRKGKNKFRLQATQPRLPHHTQPPARNIAGTLATPNEADNQLHQSLRTVKMSTSKQGIAATPIVVPTSPKKQAGTFNFANLAVHDVHSKEDDGDDPSSSIQSPNVPDGKDTLEQSAHHDTKDMRVQNAPHIIKDNVSDIVDDGDVSVSRPPNALPPSTSNDVAAPCSNDVPAPCSRDVAAPCSNRDEPCNVVAAPCSNSIVSDSQALVLGSPSSSYPKSDDPLSQEGGFQTSKALALILNKVRNDPNQNTRSSIRRSGRVNEKIK